MIRSLILIASHLSRFSYKGIAFFVIRKLIMSIHHKVFPYIFLSKHYSFIITFGFLMHLKLLVTGLEMVSIYMEYILIIILLFTENVLYLWIALANGKNQMLVQIFISGYTFCSIGSTSTLRHNRVHTIYTVS